MTHVTSNSLFAMLKSNNIPHESSIFDNHYRSQAIKGGISGYHIMCLRQWQQEELLMVLQMKPRNTVHFRLAPIVAVTLTQISSEGRVA